MLLLHVLVLLSCMGLEAQGLQLVQDWLLEGACG